MFFLFILGRFVPCFIFIYLFIFYGVWIYFLHIVYPVLSGLIVFIRF